MDKNDILEIFGHMLQIQGNFSTACAKMVEMLVPLAQSPPIEIDKLEEVMRVIDEANALLSTTAAILERQAGGAGSDHRYRQTARPG